MISAMREYFRGLKLILLFVVFAFIVTSVVYFGTGTVSGPRGDVVATVNGEAILFDRFRRAQAGFIRAYERASQQRMTAELAERLGLAQQVLNQLIVEAVIVQGAAQEGVQVGDDELRTQIQQMREFHVDGRFSRDEYLRVLRRERFEPGDFESDFRRALIARKMEGLVKEGIKVSEAEVRQAWELRHDRVRAAWAALETRPLMAKVEVPEADLEPYLKSHQARFSRPERRRLQYAVVSPKLFAQPVADAEAEAYYKEHAREFEEPRRLRVAHVLVGVPPVGGSEAEDKARAKVAEVIRRARAGEDFAKLAREVSEDRANAAQGGDLGFVGAGELVPQFERAAFALKKGEVSPEPVRTPFGFHAIKVLDVREGGRVPFKEAAPRIKEKLLAERSDRAARARAEELKPTLQAAADFVAAARTHGLQASQAVVARGDSLEGIGRDQALEETVFSLAVGGVAPAAKTAGGYVIVKVLERLLSGVPPLAEIKEEVREAIKQERAEATAFDRAKQLQAAASQGGDFLAVARAQGFQAGEIPFFSQAEPAKETGALPGAALLAALQTAPGQVAEPVRTGSGVYVVKTLGRRAADPLGFDKERGALERQLIEQKREAAWEGWIRGRMLAAKTDITGQPTPPRR